MITTTLKTIRLNRKYWQKKIPFFKYFIENPLQVFSKDPLEFSKAMSSFRFSGVYKSTRADRHNETHNFLIQYINLNLKDPPVILDIGASDGTTSLQLIEKIDDHFKKYYVTDYNITCKYVTQGKFTYFFDQSGRCFLIATNKYSFFPENKWLFNLLFNKNLSVLKAKPKSELLLCNQYLKHKAESNKSICILPYNIFEPWSMDQPDIVIVGNLLNPIYFSESEIFKGLSSCFNAMHKNSILAVIRNSPLSTNLEKELASFYKKNNELRKFDLVFHINGGIEINDFILSNKF